MFLCHVTFIVNGECLRKGLEGLFVLVGIVLCLRVES